MSKTIDEKLEVVARAGEERRERASAELLALSETLARLEGEHSAAGVELNGIPAGVEQRRRLVVLGAVASPGDEDAAAELDALDAEAAELRRRIERLDLAMEVAHERLRELRGILHETTITRIGLANGSIERQMREREEEERELQGWSKGLLPEEPSR